MTEVLDAAGLVSYAEGSVVSRMLINRDTGSATIFAFDNGEGLLRLDHGALTEKMRAGFPWEEPAGS